MRVVDLTGPLEPGVWRYDDAFPAFASEPVTSMEEHGFVVRKVTIGTHMGTHADALGHLVANGPMIDAMPLESYVGRATVIRLDDAGPLTAIDATALRRSGAVPARDEIALVETGWSRRWNSPGFTTSHPFLSEDAANWLIECGVKCVAMDTPGLMDPRIDLGPGARGHDVIVDQLLLEAGVPYIAGLVNLASIGEAHPLFVAVPLKLAGLDGAPVRAIAIEGLEGRA